MLLLMRKLVLAQNTAKHKLSQTNPEKRGKIPKLGDGQIFLCPTTDQIKI